jgi:hypothetical protein
MRIRKHGGLVDVDQNGAVIITPFAGQSISINGPVTQTGALSQNGIARSSVIVSLSSAQILAGNATPVVLVPAPLATQYVSIEEISFKMTRTATAYANGGALEFRYTDASGAKVTADIAATVVTTGGAGVEVNVVRGIVTSFTPVLGAAVVWRNATAPFITGTGTAIVTVLYRIVTP